MKLSKKNRLSIIAATSVAIFSLASVFGGAYAWFTLVLKQQSQSQEFAVVNTGTAELYSLDLYKFDYHKEVYGTGENEFTAIDYLNPETGEVNKYAYNTEEKSFGYEEDSSWHEVTMMNTYDPVDLVLFSGNIREMNCNAVYKFTMKTLDLVNVDLTATVVKLTEKIKEENELYLTSCVNFDLFYSSDLSDTNPLFQETDDPSTPFDESTRYHNFYPKYIDKTGSLSANEDVYYKIGYLASLKSSHTHFYGSSAEAINMVDSESISFTYDSVEEAYFLDLYVNVDYEPTVLENKRDEIYLGDIKAVFDYVFRFNFVPTTEGGGEQL